MTLPCPPRWFIADDLLAGRVTLDGYPFRYIYVSINPAITTPFSGTSGHAARVDAVLRPAHNVSSSRGAAAAHACGEQECG